MICIRCGCPDNDEHAEFCRNCGLELDGNYCTNKNCFRNDSDDPNEWNPCNTTDCFCDACGSETTFYKMGIITPHDYKKEE